MDDQVLAAVEGMDAVVNLTVLRPHPYWLSRNEIGVQCGQSLCDMWNQASDSHGAVSLGFGIVIATGGTIFVLVTIFPFIRDDLYALTKYRGNDITRIFAESTWITDVFILSLHARDFA